MNKMDSIDKFIKENLKESRLAHTYSVRETAVALAKQYGADADKAALAALYHDAYKFLKGEEMDKCIKELGLPERYLGNNNLAHSKISAIKIRQEFGENDNDIINAVSYHTTGRAGMSILEKVIYLADAIEPLRDYPGVEELRAAAKISLDEACLLSMEHTRDFVMEKGQYMDPDTLSAIEYFKSTLNK